MCKAVNRNCLGAHLPCREVESALRTGLRIVAQWERVTQDLTGIQWPVHAHVWEGRWVLTQHGRGLSLACRGTKVPEEVPVWNTLSQMEQHKLADGAAAASSILF